MIEYSSFVECLNEMLLSVDSSFNINFWNNASENITGLKFKDVEGISIFKLFPDLLNKKTDLDRVLQSHTSNKIVIQYYTSDIIHVFELSIFPCNSGVGILARDITEHENDKIKRKQAEQRYKETLDVMLVGCVILDYDWNCIYINESMAKSAGYEVSELIGINAFVFMPEFEKHSFYPGLKKCITERMPVHMTAPITLPNWQNKWYETHAVPIPEGIFIQIHDITEYKIAEEELKYSEGRYKGTLDNMVEGCAIIDFDWKYLYVNETSAEHAHSTIVEMIGNSIFDIYPKIESSYFFESYKVTMHERKPQRIETIFTFTDSSTHWFEIHTTPIPEGIFVHSLDITSRKENEAQLKASETRFHKAFQANPNALVISDASDGTMIEINDTYMELLGVSREEVIGNNSYSLNMYKNREDREKAAQIFMEYNRLKDFETTIRKKNGEERIALLSSELLDTPEGKRILTIIKDITDFKVAEKKIHELLNLSERRAAELNAVIESFPDAVFIGNINGITKCNKNALKLLGAKSLKDLQARLGDLALRYNIRWPETGIPLAENELQFTRALHGETVEEEVVARNAENGNDVYIRVASAPVISNGEVIAAVAVETDITEKKKQELLLKTSLKEKEVLLQELYHRTKNNMQVISSLLGLKASALNDPHLTGIIDDMKNRIHAIALVHQKLYQSSNLSRVDLKSYIEDLSELLCSSYSEKMKAISITLNLVQVNVLIDTAIPCGLILTELFSNTVKYAFPDNRTGNIKISLSLEDNMIILIFSDNGIGMPDSAIWEGKLGMELIKMIGEGQLQAQVEMQNKDGVTWMFKFKDSLYFERV